MSEHNQGSSISAEPEDAEHGSKQPEIIRITTQQRMKPPPLVRDLCAEDRQRVERALVRKIDFRLLPMIILMYILNCLDRNNIASARLAGLEEELNLTSTQYNVSYISLMCITILILHVDLRQHSFCRLSPYAESVLRSWKGSEIDNCQFHPISSLTDSESPRYIYRQQCSYGD